MNYPDTGKQSEFNPAWLKMKRLDKVTDLMNDVRLNLRAVNIEFGVYNYEVFIECCNSLYAEVYATLTDDEKINAQSLKESISEVIKRYPIYRKMQGMAFGSKTELKFMNRNWMILEKLIFKYEQYIRELQDNHGLDNKYGEDEEGL